MSSPFDPVEALARTRHEFGEHGGVNLSIETSSTFTVMEPEVMPEIFSGHIGPDRGGCYLYGRHFNPTVIVLGRQLAAIESTEAAYGTASGMSAIAATLLQLCEHGDRIVSSRTVYGGTFALLHEWMPAKAGVEAEFVDTRDHEAVEEALARGARVLYVETVANPTLAVADLPRLADLAHAHGAVLVVDNTFSPMLVTPSLHGADVVVHSLTKFINGASDLIAGAICAEREFIHSLMDLHKGSLMLLGPTMDPRMANQILLRLPHLGLRMREHGRRTLFLARRLEERGYPVLYPGLESHPDHDTLERIKNPGYGHGGILCIDLGTVERAHRLEALLQNEARFGFMAVSLGYFDTLMSVSSASTSSELGEEEQASAGISPGLLRVSVGYTGLLEQRWEQLESALETLESEVGHPSESPAKAGAGA